MTTVTILNLPPIAAHTRQSDGHWQIFDPLRRQWVEWTPEEWVRQHFTSYLIAVMGYPCGMVGNEVSLRVGTGRPKRCDTVVYGADMTPLAIVEYKAPEVTLCQATFDQIVRYNTTLHARCLMVSNGLKHYALRVNPDGTSAFLNQLPSYSELLSWA